MQRFLIALVAFYRRFLSPLKGRPTCRFLPTCSEYAAEAIRVHGAARGGALALWRLCRCQPLCRGGLDPVPPVHAGASGAGTVAPARNMHDGRSG